eukprot:261014-Chlamydomonas_euryale.AAC.1
MRRQKVRLSSICALARHAHRRRRRRLRTIWLCLAAAAAATKGASVRPTAAVPSLLVGHNRQLVLSPHARLSSRSGRSARRGRSQHVVCRDIDAAADAVLAARVGRRRGVDCRERRAAGRTRRRRRRLVRLTRRIARNVDAGDVVLRACGAPGGGGWVRSVACIALTRRAARAGATACDVTDRGAS